jgi:AcrR family transcriptional regulator
MYDEVDKQGHRRYTVQQIAAEFGVSRPTIYRHLGTESRGHAERQGDRRVDRA